MRTLIILVLTGFNSFSQEGKLFENKVTHFELSIENDTIDFIVVDTVLTEEKPVFLFCQGSQPIPLFIDDEKKDVFFFGGGVSNFDVKKIKESYHLVVISMPETPLIAKTSKLNRSYSYITDSTDQHSYKGTYLKADYLENYVKRANTVLSFLLKQSWTKKIKLVVAGHSQGARVATKLASDNINITHLGLFSFNPFGRIEQMIRQERKYAKEGEKTWGEAEEKIAYWEQLWKDANNADSVEVNPELIAWKSFSSSQIDDLLTIKIPIYLCYGTEDLAAANCDIIPLIFTSNGKNNLTLKRKQGVGHNFFGVKENGQTDFKKSNWIEVMNEFVEWTNK